MVLSPHASYPHDRSYVLKLHSDASPRQGRIVGLLAVFVAPIVGMLMAKVDPRRLVCFGMLWIAAVSIWRVGATTDMTFW